MPKSTGQDLPELEKREPGLRRSVLIIEANGAGDKIVGDTRKDDHALWQSLEELGWGCEVVAFEDQQVELMKLAVGSCDAVLPRVPSGMLKPRQFQQLCAMLRKLEGAWYNPSCPPPRLRTIRPRTSANLMT